MYGFRRLNKGDDQGCYFHPKFQRARKDLLAEIKRLPEKGSLQTYDELMRSKSNLPGDLYGSNGNKRKAMAGNAVDSTFDPSGVDRSNLRRKVSSKFKRDEKHDQSVGQTLSQLPSDASAAHGSEIVTQTSTSANTMKPQFIGSGAYYPAPYHMHNGSRPLPTSANNTAATQPQYAPVMTKSKLTMNIGYGRNIFPAAAAPADGQVPAFAQKYVSAEGQAITLPISSNFSHELPYNHHNFHEMALQSNNPHPHPMTIQPSLYYRQGYFPSHTITSAPSAVDRSLSDDFDMLDVFSSFDQTPDTICLVPENHQVLSDCKSTLTSFVPTAQNNQHQGYIPNFDEAMFFGVI